MTKEDMEFIYFDWLLQQVGQRNDDSRTYRSFTRLLTYLHQTYFRWSIPRDKNRAEDGISLRYRFALDYGMGRYDDVVRGYLDDPCSVLEMMIALALQCEEQFMDDPKYGNRTSQWFWNMVVSLGLGSMTDQNFDYQYVHDTVERFLNRDYEANGKGGLFTIRRCDRDLRDAEIWYQLCWYVDSLVY